MKTHSLGNYTNKVMFSNRNTEIGQKKYQQNIILLINKGMFLEVIKYHNGQFIFRAANHFVGMAEHSGIKIFFYLSSR